MNLKVLQWLLAHKDVLLKIVEVAKGYSKSLPYLQQWEIADKVARLIIPVLEAESAKPRALATDDIYDLFGDDANLAPPREVQVLQAGTEVSALAIDWKLIAETILPLVVAILRALMASGEDD